MQERTECSRGRRTLLLPSLLLLLALWFLAGVLGLVLCRDQLATSWQGPRLSQAVVVVQSDDWGRGEYVKEEVGAFGWDEDRRQSAAVDRLCGVLRRHRDAQGRPPMISAFVVVGQPDVSAIMDDPQGEYHWLPIHVTMPKLVAALRHANTEGLFDLQYHARDHRNSRLWTKLLRQAAENARLKGDRLTRAAIDGLWPKVLPDIDEVVSEYFVVDGGKLAAPAMAEIDEKVRLGMDVFEAAFGKRAACTQAPRHLWGPQAEDVWRLHGIKYVFGVNGQRGPSVPSAYSPDRKLGFRTAGGLVGVPRTVALDLPGDGALPAVDGVLDAARRAVGQGQPVVIATHSYNYYDPTQELSEAMFERLDGVFTTLEREFPSLWYASAEEIGRLAACGSVKGTSPDGGSGITVASGLRHAWLWFLGLGQDHPKVMVWVWGAVFLILLVVTMGLFRAVRWFRWRRCAICS